MEPVSLALVSDAEGQVASVRMDRPRAPIVERLFAGLAPADAVKRASLVFGLCPMAQSRALAIALASAGVDVEGPSAADALCERVVGLVRACALDGLLGLGAQPKTDLARAAMLASKTRNWSMLADAARRAADHLVSAVDQAWALDDTSPPKPIALLTMLDAADVCARLGDDPDFARFPTLHGVAAECGPAAETFGPGPTIITVTARLRARALVLHRLAEEICAPLRRAELLLTETPVHHDGGCACAVVATSRGPLALRVKLTPDGRIASARSVAPTEWLLHPEGALAAACIGRPAIPETVRHAERVIMSLDPCVGVRVKLSAAVLGRMAADA